MDTRGEILELGETVNVMTERYAVFSPSRSSGILIVTCSLSVFADEVTRVAEEVGTDGKLGGQARVTNVSGTWKVSDLLTMHITSGGMDADPRYNHLGPYR